MRRAGGLASQVLAAKTSKLSVSVRVRCSGHFHTITLTPSGRLRLEDHPDLRAERALVALGGEPPRCLQVLDAWKKGDRAALPGDLRLAFSRARDWSWQRRQARGYTNKKDPLTVPLATRLAARVRAAAEAELARCSYRRSQTRWAGGEHVVQVRIGEPNITGEAERVWSANGKWPGTNSFVTATVPLRWYTRVYRRGLAVVNGVFVLDVLHQDKKGIHVLAGRQGPGFNVYPDHAIIKNTPNGGRVLRWVKKSKQHK